MEPDYTSRLQQAASAFERQPPGSRRYKFNPPSAIPLTLQLPTSNQLPNDSNITHVLEALTKRVEDISVYVRSQNSESQERQRNNPIPSAPVSHHSPPPPIQGLPTVHPQLLVDGSPPASCHSRSRSRSRSREHNLWVRSRKIYGLIYVPCPFSDNKQTMTPEARAKSSAQMRKLYRQVLGDFYSFHHTATSAAKETLASQQATAYKTSTWEEQTLLNYAHQLDLFLLNANSGSWTLWSEPGIEWLVRSFLQMAIRASQKNEPPAFLDRYLAGRIRRLKYGDNSKFGPVTNRKQARKPGPAAKSSIDTGGVTAPFTPALLDTLPSRKSPNPSSR